MWQGSIRPGRHDRLEGWPLEARLSHEPVDMGGNLTLGLSGTNGCKGVWDDPRQQTSGRPERRDLVRIFPAPRTFNHTIGWHEREARRVP